MLINEKIVRTRMKTSNGVGTAVRFLDSSASTVLSAMHLSSIATGPAGPAQTH